MNAFSFFRRGFAARLAETFLEADSGERYTYAELERETARVASFLTGLGLQKGDRVAVQVDKSPQSLFLYLACLRAGLCLPAAQHRVSARRARLLPAATPSRASSSAGRRSHEHVRGAGQSAGAPRLLTLDENGKGSLAEAPLGAAATFDDRGARRERPRSDHLHLGHDRPLEGRDGHARQPLVERAGAGGVLGIHRAGRAAARAADLPRARPVRRQPLRSCCPARRCSSIASSSAGDGRARPPARHRADGRADLLHAAARRSPDSRARRWPTCGCSSPGSAPLLIETFQEFEARTGQRILERYGMSEAGMITSNPLEGERRGGTVGFPLPGVSVRIVDDERRVRGPGATGGIQIRGRTCSPATGACRRRRAEEFTADGWFRTGDVGQWSAGRLSLDRRPRQGPHHHRRLQRLPEGDRAGDRRDAGRARVRGDRPCRIPTSARR